jgi:hypothetical protein
MLCACVKELASCFFFTPSLPCWLLVALLLNSLLLRCRQSLQALSPSALPCSLERR